MSRCTLCSSPFRTEILRLWNNTTVKKVDIYNTYKPKLGLRGDYPNFWNMVNTHIKEKHKATDRVLVPMDKEDVMVTGTVAKITLDNFAQRLLDLAAINIEANPGGVKVKDAIAAQKLLMERDKIKLTQDSMMLQMAKLFGPGSVDPVVEGEVIDDGANRRIESPTDQPANP